jgi:hypothetical protein
VKAHQHLAAAVKFSPSEIKKAMSEVEGFNAKVAVLITKGVGTMACAYAFCMISLASLPAILTQAGALSPGAVPHFLINPGLILIVAWIAQTFIQLVLLSIIMVGQDVQSKTSDARAESTFKDTEQIIDALSTKTEGGLKIVLDAINNSNRGGASLDASATENPGGQTCRMRHQSRSLPARPQPTPPQAEAQTTTRSPKRSRS